MSWMFWKNKSNTVEEYLQRFDGKLEEINQQLENNGDAIQKSLRLEYKSSQEIFKKLDQIKENIDENMDYSTKYTELEHERDKLIKEKNFVLARNIQWLDDIDLICGKIDGQEKEHWIQLLQNWQKEILKSLEELRIFEIDIIGKTFNHEVAESVSTKKKEINKDYLPYEVVEVLQRGFIFEGGTLLRKAKVITIEEEER